MLPLKRFTRLLNRSENPISITIQLKIQKYKGKNPAMSINPASSHVLIILPKLKLSSKQDDLKSLEGKNLHQRFSLGLNLVKKEKLELIIYVLNTTKSTGK